MGETQDRTFEEELLARRRFAADLERNGVDAFAASTLSTFSSSMRLSSEGSSSGGGAGASNSGNSFGLNMNSDIHKQLHQQHKLRQQQKQELESSRRAAHVDSASFEDTSLHPVRSLSPQVVGTSSQPQVLRIC